MGKFRSNSELTKDYEKGILWLHHSKDKTVATIHKICHGKTTEDIDRAVNRLNSVEFVLNNLIGQYGDIRYNADFKIKKELAWFKGLGLEYPYNVEDFENLPKE